MNKKKYENLVKELNKLSGEAVTPAGIRTKLTENLPQGSNLKDVTAVLVAFYEYTKQNSDLTFLTDFCEKTLSSYYSEDRINNDFENIVKDELLLDKLLNICNDSVIEKLYKHASAMNGIYVKTGNNSYTEAYNKIRKKYESIDPVLVSRMTTINAEQKSVEETVSKAQATTNESKAFSSVSDANAQIESNNNKVSDLLWENERIENEKRKHAEDMLNNEASKLQNKGVNITADQLHDTIEKNNIDAKENEGIYYSLSMGRVFDAKERLLSLPFSNFTKLVEKTSGFVMKKADYDVITVDGKRNIFVKSNKKTDMLASVDEKVADLGENVALKIATAKDGWHKVVNKAYCKKVEMTQMVVDTKNKATETIKNLMSNLKSKTKKIIKDTKDKKEELAQMASQKIEDFDNSIRDNVSNGFRKAAEKLSEIASKVSPAISVPSEDISVLSPDENNKQYQSFSADEIKAVLNHMISYRQGIKGKNANVIASDVVLPQLASSNGMAM